MWCAWPSSPGVTWSHTPVTLILTGGGCGVRLPVLPTPEGVEAMERWKDGQRRLFLLNHADQARDVALSQPLTDLLTDQVTERQHLNPRQS